MFCFLHWFALITGDGLLAVPNVGSWMVACIATMVVSIAPAPITEIRYILVFKEQKSGTQMN
jgi:hypothetical protein